jgi:hypothetical protein
MLRSSVILVATAAALMLAPLITAPEESVTVPSRVARSVCANAGHAIVKRVKGKSSLSALLFTKVIENPPMPNRRSYKRELVHFLLKPRENGPEKTSDL